MKKGAFKGTLNETPVDAHDFPLEGVVGSANIATLPRAYTVSSPLVIKDQGPDTDMCYGYALTSVSEDQEGVVLDPFYTVGRTRQIMGADPSAWGADLRSACKSAVAPYGCRPMLSNEIVRVTSPATQEMRDIAVRWERIPKVYDEEARRHAKKSFFSVGGGSSRFDNMRSGMYQMRMEERSILTGINWAPEWTQAKNGEVDESIEVKGARFGHAIKVFGWDLDDWMIAQLSNGKDIGEGGIFKIHRNIIDRHCTFGAFTFLDMPREEAEYELGKVGWWRYWVRSIFS